MDVDFLIFESKNHISIGKIFMNQIVLNEPGNFVLRDVPAPEKPGAGEVLCRVKRIGICGTDLHAFKGDQPFFNYPRVLGHELGVEVVEVGAGVTTLKAGDKCAVEPYLTCGKCVACRAGKTNCCMELLCLGVHTDGGMGEYLKMPAAKLHKSDKLSLDQLALVETLGIGCHAVDRANVQAGEWVLVIGTGPIGLAAIQFAKAAKANVIAMDVNESRLKFCQEQLGVEYLINAKDSPLEKISELTSKELPTVVFEATGNRDSMHGSFQYISHGGRLVFIGLVQGEITFNDPHFHRREITLMSSRNSTAKDFKRIIGLIEEGTVNTTPWITHRAKFTEMIPQFPTWLDPKSGCIKALLEL